MMPFSLNIFYYWPCKACNGLGIIPRYLVLTVYFHPLLEQLFLHKDETLCPGCFLHLKHWHFSLCVWWWRVGTSCSITIIREKLVSIVTVRRTMLSNCISLTISLTVHVFVALPRLSVKAHITLIKPEMYFPILQHHSTFIVVTIH